MTTTGTESTPQKHSKGIAFEKTRYKVDIVHIKLMLYTSLGLRHGRAISYVIKCLVSQSKILFLRQCLVLFLVYYRVVLDASDEESGVHKIEYKIIVGNQTVAQRSGYVSGNMNNASLNRNLFSRRICFNCLALNTCINFFTNLLVKYLLIIRPKK